MSGMTDRDKAELARSLVGPDYAMSATRAVAIAKSLAESPWLDEYVARHVRAALTEAAEWTDNAASVWLTRPDIPHSRAVAVALGTVADNIRDLTPDG